MNEGLIPRRYAKALLLVAREKGEEAMMYDVMKTLSESFVQFPSLSETLNNPYVSVADKERLILTAAGLSDGSKQLLEDFVKLLSNNRRIGMMRLISIAYVELYREENHIYSVNIQSASKMSPKDESRLKEMVQKHLKDGKMEYTVSVDPNLIGGFTVSVGNEKLDASISNELKQLRLNLLSK